MNQESNWGSQGGETQESSAAIKAGIDRTRNAMSEKIDAIQDRVNPENLRQQAQEGIRSTVQEGAETVMNYARDYGAEWGGSLVDMIKQNPVPAALIGLGAGWLIYNSLTHNQSSYNRTSRAGRQPYRYGSGYGYPSGSTGDYGYGGEYGYGNRQGYSGQYGYTAEGYQMDPSMAGSQGQWSSQGGGNTMTEQVRDKVDQAKDAVSGAVGQASNTISETVNQAAERVQGLGSQVSGAGQYAQQQMQEYGGQARELVEANPLALGAAALAVGAALGLILPSTRQENAVMGEWRDQAMDRAKSVADQARQRVQEVVEEVRPELEQIASRVVDDVSQAGKEAVTEVKESTKRAVERTTESTAS